jgi:IclR family acetate operon transcriptional repressor
VLIGSDTGARAADDRYVVHSVDRAMRLLMIVADGPPEGLSLSDLARALGTSKSTTLALARTLVGFDLLADARPGPRYTLGAALIGLGDRAIRTLPFGEVFQPILTELTQLTGLTSEVAVIRSGSVVFAGRVVGPENVSAIWSIGSASGFRSAAGRAMLATMTAAEIRSVTGGKLDVPSADLAVARDRGFAVAEDEAPGVICIGAAFFADDGSCAGALSLACVGVGWPSWRIGELGRTVRRFADKMSAALGGAGGVSRVQVASGDSSRHPAR